MEREEECVCVCTEHTKITYSCTYAYVLGRNFASETTMAASENAGTPIRISKHGKPYPGAPKMVPLFLGTQELSAVKQRHCGNVQVIILRACFPLLQGVWGLYRGYMGLMYYIGLMEKKAVTAVSL